MRQAAGLNNFCGQKHMDELQVKPDSRRIPQVDKMLRHPLLLSLQNEFRREVLAEITRRVLADYRSPDSGSLPDDDSIANQIQTRLTNLSVGNLRKIVNGTGIILSTNLGRAPLAKAAVDKIAEILQGYSNLEVNLKNGKRGERATAVKELLSLLTNCQSAIIVNNNAAAVMLAVTALAHKKEVIISRGELIEIGGSFRLPDVIESAGASLKEVGTTNRTRAADYQKVITENTGMILKCHRSNFEISGFTEMAKTADLVAIGKNHQIPVVEDLGSGALIDYSKIGMKYEPTVAEVIDEGVDLVMFSADKLMGGSQAGIVCGKAEYVKLLRDHPMYRALRADKLTIAILEQVLCEYLRLSPENHITVMQMATKPASELKSRAEAFIKKAKRPNGHKLTVVETRSAFGGGTLPGHTIESFGIAIAHDDTVGSTNKNSPDKLLTLLRGARTPVIAIIQDDQVVIDFRTVQPHDEPLLLEALESLSGFATN
ncbi:MAG: L-seryl-tRNA(Sec) selenium transferase [Cyanobacteria bacterium SZAS-4]|nr:L-seryl-tRNA(Sec) selenium transferase [Cyanobacteria bacterium SZAS-4]